MLYRSANGKYQVEIAEDGAIKVRRGDRLIHYALAIHKRVAGISEFGRKNSLGKLVPIRQPNLQLYVNEIVYHVPTYRKHLNPSQQPTVITFDQGSVIVAVSKAEQERILRDDLQQGYHLPGEHLEWIIGVYHRIIDPLDAAAFLLEVMDVLHGVAALAGTSVSILHAFVFPVFAGAEFANALDTSERMYAMRAIAYTTTAWAFGETPPQESGTVVRNEANWPQLPGHGKEAREKAWREASAAALAILERQPTAKGMSKDTFQGALRAISKNDKAKLCLLLLQGFESQVPSAARASWIAGYDIQYPQ